MFVGLDALEARARRWRRRRCSRSNARVGERHLDQRPRLRVVVDEQDADDVEVGQSSSAPVDVASRAFRGSDVAHRVRSTTTR